MKKQLICLNSDGLNRDNTIFPLGTLEKSLRDIYNYGMTMCIGHDLHRPIGWVIPFGLYIEPKLSRMYGQRLIATTQEDYGQIYNAHQNHILKKYSESFNEIAQPFLEVIGVHLTEQHMKIYAGCPAVYDDGIVEKCLPGFFDQIDDDGLISINTLLQDFNYLGQGVFKQKFGNLAIYAHRYFRRSQSIHNNFHFSFLDELLKQASNPDLKTKIRIDENMVGYAPAFHQSLEHEYHYGPKYTDDISNIKFGITRHEADDFQRDYYGINRSEFLWKHDDKEITFETEELRDTPSLFESDLEEIYNCRYVHSIYNSELSEFIHFDGAIRSYSMEEMSDRLDKTFLEYGRKAVYTKLFRIDGKLALAKWKILVTHYLQGNPLVYEYFGVGEEYQSIKEANERDVEIALEQKLVPFAIEKGDGVRLMLSYHQTPNEFKKGRYVEIYDQMTSDNGTLYCAEHFIYEVKKALLKVGEDLEIDPTVMKIKCDDRYWNIPSIMHNTEDPGKSLAATKTALLTLFKAMNTRGIDIDISFTLAFPVNGRIVRVSSYGNIVDQIHWLENQSPIFCEDEQLASWVIEQQKYLSNFPVKPDAPLSASMIQFDGVLFLKRKPVMFEYELENTPHGLRYKILLPEDGEEYQKIMTAGLISAIGLIEIKEAFWSDTGDNYFEGDRSMWLDRNEKASVNITKWEPLALYWSKSGNKIQKT